MKKVGIENKSKLRNQFLVYYGSMVNVALNRSLLKVLETRNPKKMSKVNSTILYICLHSFVSNYFIV